MSDNTSNNARRRSSITQAALSNLFQRGSSANNAPSLPGAPAMTDPRGRRLSLTTLGLSGSSPTNRANLMRRESVSTNSNPDSIDESAVEDDDLTPATSRTTPLTPFARRMSLGGPATMRGYRPSASSANGNTNPNTPSLAANSSHPPPPVPARRFSTNNPPPLSSTVWSASGRRPSAVLPSSLPQASYTMHKRTPSDFANSRTDQQGYNWSEQLKSRAESSVSGARPSFSLASGSPSRSHHDRAKSVSDMVSPPTQPPPPAAPPRQQRPKPDAFQERILKGDFYMD